MQLNLQQEMVGHRLLPSAISRQQSSAFFCSVALKDPTLPGSKSLKWHQKIIQIQSQLKAIISETVVIWFMPFHSQFIKQEIIFYQNEKGTFCHIFSTLAYDDLRLRKNNSGNRKQVVSRLHYKEQLLFVIVDQGSKW